MSKEITNLALVIFVNQFKQLTPLTGFDFVMQLEENFEIIEAEVKRLSKVNEPSEKMKEYNKRGSELYQEYSEKSPNGGPKTRRVTTNTGQTTEEYVLDRSRQAEFTEKFEALKKEFAKEIETQEKKDLDYREGLDKPINKQRVKLIPISKDDIPENISAGQARLLGSVGLIKL